MRQRAALGIMILILCFTITGCSLSLSPDDSGAYDKGVAALKESDFATALKEFQNAVTVDGRAAEGYRGQGLVYLAQENYKFAANLFDMSLDAMAVDNPEFVEDVNYYKAESLKKSLRTDQAISLYEELTDGTTPYLAYAMLGKIYLEQGDTKKAKEEFDLSAENGADYNTYLLIYQAYKDASLEADGTDYLEASLLLQPVSSQDYADLGQVYYELEDHSKAIENLLRAIDMGNDDAVMILGRIYIDDNNVTSARQLFEDSLKKGLNAAYCYNGLALCSLADDRANTALQYIEEGLKTAEDEAKKSLLFNEVIAYEQLRDFTSAKEKALEFLTMYSNDSQMKREYQFLSNS